MDLRILIYFDFIENVFDDCKYGYPNWQFAFRWIYFHLFRPNISEYFLTYSFLSHLGVYIYILSILWNFKHCTLSQKVDWTAIGNDPNNNWCFFYSDEFKNFLNIFRMYLFFWIQEWWSRKDFLFGFLFHMYFLFA